MRPMAHGSGTRRGFRPSAGSFPLCAAFVYGSIKVASTRTIAEPVVAVGIARDITFPGEEKEESQKARFSEGSIIL